jgi:hypothetical protein
MAATLELRKMEGYLSTIGQECGDEYSLKALNGVPMIIHNAWTIMCISLAVEAVPIIRDPYRKNLSGGRNG